MGAFDFLRNPMSLKAIQEAYEREKQNRQQFMQGAIQPAIGGMGMFLQNDSNPMGAAFGGAMTGFGMGGPLGAILGFGSGLLGAGKKRADQDSMDRIQWNNMISAKASEPSIYAKDGAFINAVDEIVDLQTQKGEMIAHPTGMITKVMATKKHKDADEDDVSDSLPFGAYVASDEKGTEITKEDAEEFILGVKPLMYDEKGNKSEYEPIRLSDVFGENKRLTPAAFLRRLQKHVPVPLKALDKIDDPISDITAAENMETRKKYVSGIMELNARKNKKLRKQMDMINQIMETEKQIENGAQEQA